MKRIMIKAVIKLDAYRVLSDRLEEAVACLVRRADKHADDPLSEAQRERVIHTVEDGLMGELCEVLKFGDE